MPSALIRCSAVLAAMLPATSCIGPPAGVVSLYPLYREQELIASPDLSGEWTEIVEKKVTWTFQRSSGSLYRLTINNPDDPGPLTFAVGLLRLGDYLFLDLKPDDAVIERYYTQLIPVHIFSRVWVEQDAFLIRPLLDGDWFKREALAGNVHLGYVRMEEYFFLLTAPTRDLQQFALQHATNGEAFPRASSITFVRAESP